MTVNQFQQNISVKLAADDFSSTLLTRSLIEFPVDLTKKFNIVYSVYAHARR